MDNEKAKTITINNDGSGFNKYQLHHGLFLDYLEPIEILGREKEQEQALEALYKTRMHTAVLVGEAGTGKTSIAQSLNGLQDEFAFFSLDLGSMQAGCTLVGMFEQRLLTTINSVVAYNRKTKKLLAEGEIKRPYIALFIDEIHRVSSINGNSGSGTTSMAEHLKPILTEPELYLIGATTREEYKYIERDRALKRRMTPIYVDPLPGEVVVSIVRKFAPKLSEELAWWLYNAMESVEGYENPDKCIEVADRAIAKTRRHPERKWDKDLLEEAISDFLGKPFNGFRLVMEGVTPEFWDEALKTLDEEGSPWAKPKPPTALEKSS